MEVLHKLHKLFFWQTHRPDIFLLYKVVMANVLALPTYLPSKHRETSSYWSHVQYSLAKLLRKYVHL